MSFFYLPVLLILVLSTDAYKDFGAKTSNDRSQDGPWQIQVHVDTCYFTAAPNVPVAAEHARDDRERQPTVSAVRGIQTRAPVDSSNKQEAAAAATVAALCWWSRSTHNLVRRTLTTTETTVWIMGNTASAGGIQQPLAFSRHRHRRHRHGNKHPQESTPIRRPFEANKNSNKNSKSTWKARLRFSSNRQTRHKQTILQQLILRQDWQRVLARTTLFPEEWQQIWTFELLPDLPLLQLAPLHLACALDPPVTVVQLALQLHAAACSTAVQASSTVPVPRPTLRKTVPRPARLEQAPRGSRRRLAGLQWRGPRQGAVPRAATANDRQQQDRALLLPLPNEAALPAAAIYCTAPSDCHYHDAIVNRSRDSSSSSSSSSSNASSMSSRHSLDRGHGKGIILQLSPSGGLQPLRVHSHETARTLDASAASLFCVHWDLQPLAAACHGMLLPLNVACLYQASPAVVQALVDAYPLAVLNDVEGMLPIHWVAAGWTLPVLVEPPATLVPKEGPAGPLQTLQVLVDAVPNSVRVQSGNHALTPAAYIEECMEEGDYKEACLRVLQPPLTKQDDASFMKNDDGIEDASLSTAGSLLFVDSSETSSLCFAPSVTDGHASSITLLLSTKDWTGALAAVEDDPSAASVWLYGVNDDDDDVGASLTVWKRLPIQLACAYGAPVGLVEVLLQAYPAGGTAADPRTGFLPLHTACQSGATLAVIRALLSSSPEATKAVDIQGRLPVHVAVVQAAAYTVVEAMVEHDPDSAVALDQDGNTPLDYAVQCYGRNHVVVELLTMVGVFLQETSI